MDPTRKLASASLMLALSLAAIAAAPAAAGADSRITFVNGVPGTPIDICLGGKEAKSGLRYGQQTSRVRDNGSWTLKVFKKDPRRCRGVKLAQMQIPLAFQDLLIVVTKKAPRLLVWDDTSLTIGSPGGYTVFRHAADTGDVSFKLRTILTEAPYAPAVDPVWQKGDTNGFPVLPDSGHFVRVTRPDRTAGMTKRKIAMVEDQHRTYSLYVGSRNRNDKVVVFRKPFWVVP